MHDHPVLTRKGLPIQSPKFTHAGAVHSTNLDGKALALGGDLDVTWTGPEKEQLLIRPYLGSTMSVEKTRSSHLTSTPGFPNSCYCAGVLLDWHIVVLVLRLHDPSIDVLSHFRRNAVQERLVLTHQSHRVARLAPAGVATHFHPLRFDLLSKFGQIGSDGAFRHGRGNEDPDCGLALGVDETREDVWLKTVKKALDCATISNGREE